MKPSRDAASPPLGPGISRDLAVWRASRYSDVRYSLDVTIDDAAEWIIGTVTIGVSLRDPMDLVLDWRPRGGTAEVLDVNDRSIRPRGVRDHLVVPASATRGGNNHVRIRFRSPIATGGTAVTRYDDPADRSRYVYTLFVPAEASTVFPCFDQPDLKARWSLVVAAPASWRVVGNAPLVRTRSTGAVRSHHFAATPPLSTYLFAFAAGPFAKFAGRGPTAAIYVRRSAARGARASVRTALSLSDRSLAWLTRETRHTFPFPKYEVVLVPDFPFGGMEHAGATFLREAAVLLPPGASMSELRRRAHLVFHENAHQWFGDLVTMPWFDDLWLKEGFANRMADAQLRALAPERAHDAARLAEEEAALRLDDTRGSVPLHRPLDDLLDAKASYGPAVYQKAPAVLRMLEREIGRVAFRRGARTYLRAHAFGIADWRDLVQAMERHGGHTLSRWARHWILENGAPALRTRLELGSKGTVRRAVIEQAGRDGQPTRWPLTFDLRVWDAKGRARDIAVRCDRPTTRIPALEGRAPPRAILMNASGTAYGRFSVDAASAKWLFDSPRRLADPRRRALAWNASWQAVREGEIPAADYLERTLVQLPRERDERIAAILLDRLVLAVGRYLPDETAEHTTPHLETALDAWIPTISSDALRVAAFRASVQIARSAPARERLKAHLAQERLPSADRFRIVERLAILDDPDARRLLAAETARDRSGEGRRRAFAAGAAIRDASVKRRYLSAFLTDASLPDAWIDAALPVVNAPEHAALTAPLLPRALAALPRLQARRSIFLVNQWIAAFVEGRRDEAARGVAEAVAARPDMPPDLARKLEGAADELRITLAILRGARRPRPSRS